MTAAETVRVGRNRRRERSPLQRAVRIGIVFGVVAVYIAVVGILPLMNSRWIVVDVLSLGDAALLAIGLGAGAAVAARRSPSGYLPLAFQSFIAGGLAGSLLALLTAAMSFFDLRRIFIALSPALLQTLTFDLGVPLGPVLVVGAGALLAVLGAGLSLGPRAIGKPILVGFAFVLFFGVFQELIQIMMQFGTLVSDLPGRASVPQAHWRSLPLRPGERSYGQEDCESKYTVVSRGLPLNTVATSRPCGY